MKRFILFACLYTALGPASFAVSRQDLDTYPNYVVIGAFAHHKNAIRFTEDANQHNFPAKFEMNHNRKLYYVFVLTTDDREHAFAEALKLRTETKYFDTWVYSGPFDEVASTTYDAVAQDFNPATGEKINQVSAEQVDDGTPRAEYRATDRAGNAELESTRTSGNVEADNPTQNRTNADVVNGQRLATGTVRNDHPSNNEQKTTPDAKDAGIKAGSPTTTSKKNDPTRNDAAAGVTSSSMDNTLAPSIETEHNGNVMQGPGLAEPGGTENENEKNSGTVLSASHKSRVGPADISNVNGPPPASEEDVTSQTTAHREFPKKVNTAPLTAEEVVGKNFFFQLFRADNHEWVEGEVDAVDFDRSRKMASYKANAPVKVIVPSTKSKRISFVCQVFGYRKQQIEFDPASPSPDFFLDENGNLIVPFELIRLQKGDIAIMYNVFFFKDAAVMRPESRYEVNNLLDLLNENPSYKIRIHGHTNGNASGKIIRMDNTENFYSLSNTSNGFGSAKKLSEERALVIKQFLVSSGISEGRMEVKAWGGKKPIHDKNSVRAIENVRVEIEILSD